ncbi:hypothetical protein OIU85_013140 [Salix viminalis]|uniref:Uncharacterized protein n=1 Tax=Salix viminalis TaxID=40686 RepID=A0A9Q0NQQ5_SALVM|nr:hypothetical protein OIU85_013140 [Salix viminalis]
MVLRRPAMNRSCNRENPDILIVMIAEKQIMRGDGDDKERETMGPQKPAREMSGTAPKTCLGCLREPTYFVNRCGTDHFVFCLQGMLVDVVLQGLSLPGVLYRPSLISLLCFYTANSAREIWKLKNIKTFKIV